MPQSNIGRKSFVDAEQELKMTTGQDAHLMLSLKETVTLFDYMPHEVTTTGIYILCWLNSETASHVANFALTRAVTATGLFLLKTMWKNKCMLIRLPFMQVSQAQTYWTPLVYAFVPNVAALVLSFRRCWWWFYCCLINSWHASASRRDAMNCCFELCSVRRSTMRYLFGSLIAALYCCITISNGPIPDPLLRFPSLQESIGK